MTSTAGRTNRPLLVKDAMGYLDLVKNEFHDRPEVYSQFLNIMKEFRAQSIGTPEVIQRISTLFEGHSELLGGFNAFLPAGDRIEVAQAEVNF